MNLRPVFWQQALGNTRDRRYELRSAWLNKERILRHFSPEDLSQRRVRVPNHVPVRAEI